MDDTAQSAQIVFMPSGKRGCFNLGTPVLECARALGVDIDSVCGGRGICGRCQVDVTSGHFAKHGIESRNDHLEALTEPETRFDEKKGLAAGRRLSCHARLAGDVLIDVPPESQVHKQVVRKRAEARAIELDPVIRLYYIEVGKAGLAIAGGDFERVREALREQWNIDLRDIDLNALARLQQALRDAEWKITVAVHDGARIIRVWSGFHDTAYGFAVDIGSTTIAAHLCDLASGEIVASTGVMNPQIRFGEDLMSRVSYAMMNEGGAGEMTAAVRAGLDRIFVEAADESNIDNQDIVAATFVGNPVMHHLFLSLNPEQLGFAPFALATDTALEMRASELGLHALYPDARCYLLPCIAGHVGADTAAMVLAESPHLKSDITLLVDIGTNAELVLGNRGRLLTASSPTGPAFEGAQISAGQRAAPGAIERVRIDRKSFEPRFKVIGCDLWSEEEGFDEAIREIGVTGICGSGIIEALAEMFLAGLLNSNGIIDGGLAERSNRLIAYGRTFSYLLYDGSSDGKPQIFITQNDIRAIQLAKGALYAGAQLLMNEMGVSRLDRITLAGAFGSHIDVKYAMILGLIPDCDLDRVTSAGNAAGTGAMMALLNAGARTEIEALARKIEKVETAIEPRFQEFFIDAMAIPHKTAPYTHLRQRVDLPLAKTTKPLRRRRERQI